MREILFRGKRIDINKWVYGQLYNEENKCFIVIDIELTERGIADACVYVVTPESVGQYTGEKDINGKRIFEGDTLTGNHIKSTVTFEDGMFLVGDSYSLKQENFKWEIIGNIYNKELA